MKQVYDFLSCLQENNNREWFNSHKDEYKQVQAYFNSFVESLIYEISLWDKDICDSNLQIKDCTYRIYKDLRFSKDKLPYKTHMGAYICKGGKKSEYSGYYFHIEPKGEGEHSYLGGNLLACGLYCPSAQIIRSVRDEVYVNGSSFLNAMSAGAQRGFVLDNSSALKKVPKGFEDVRLQWADLLKQKDYCLVKNVTKEYVLGENLLERVVEDFKCTYEFNRILNLAVDFALEEM